MNLVLTRAIITPADRLGLTLCLAIMVHAVVILGVSFAPIEDSKPRFETLEVILVSRQTEETPEDADYLAQARLEGGGESDDKERPATPLSSLFPEQDAEIRATASGQAPPAPTREPEAHEQQLPDTLPVEALRDDTSALDKQPDELAAETPEAQKPLPESDSEPAIKPLERPAAEESKLAAHPVPPAASLISNAIAIASLNAEIQQRLEAKAKRPRRKFLSANTKEYKFAAYMDAWRAKVERVGNLNYPDEARRRKMTGSLILDVALSPDGSVSEMTIRRSSGQPILDDAAMRIVKLAAPFAPFPLEIRKDIDILHITRTWQFFQGHRFSSK